MMKTPIRSPFRKKGISPIKITEISSIFPKFSFEEASPSNLQTSEGSPKILLPKIPNSVTSPNLLQTLNEKFSKKTSFDVNYKENFESYCNRANMMTSQREVEDFDGDEKNQIFDIIRQRNKKLASAENFGNKKN